MNSFLFFYKKSRYPIFCCFIFGGSILFLGCINIQDNPKSMTPADTLKKNYSTEHSSPITGKSTVTYKDTLTVLSMTTPSNRIGNKDSCFLYISIRNVGSDICTMCNVEDLGWNRRDIANNFSGHENGSVPGGIHYLHPGETAIMRVYPFREPVAVGYNYEFYLSSIFACFERTNACKTFKVSTNNVTVSIFQ